MASLNIPEIKLRYKTLRGIYLTWEIAEQSLLPGESVEECYILEVRVEDRNLEFELGKPVDVLWFAD